MKKLLLYLSIFLIVFIGTGCETLEEKESKADQLRQESQALLAEHMKSQQPATNESGQEEKEPAQQSTSSETTAVAVATNTTSEPEQNVTEPVEQKTETAENQSNNRVSATVTKVVDGDTIKVQFDGKEETVRMIGVDTPESVHPDKSRNSEEGKIASNYTKAQLEGKTVELEFDVQQRDKYGRLLAYVWLGNTLYNSQLLSQGMAQVATYPPNVKYVDTFTALQKEAREKKVGLWADAQPKKQEKVAEKPKQQVKQQQKTEKKQEVKKQEKKTETPKKEYNTTPPAGAKYIGNSNPDSMKFHKASCGSVKKMKAGHMVKFNSREEAINAGYKPCKRCNP